MSLVICSSPGCQTSAGCKCVASWPWQVPQVPARTAGGTGPLNGYAMEPSEPSYKQAAAIICGHDFIQAFGEDKMLEFEQFVREVLRTTLHR